MQLVVVVADCQEVRIAAAWAELGLQLAHEQSRVPAQTVASMMDGAARAFRVAAEDGDEFVALRQISFDAFGGVMRKCCALLDNRFVAQCVADALARCPLAREAERVDLRAGHLQNADTVLVAALKHVKIHRRAAGRTVVARVLVEDALDDGNEASPARIRPGRASSTGLRGWAI